MKNVFIILTGLVLAAGMAFGYTMPGAFPYDALVTYDHGGMPVKAGALHISANPSYWMASKYYDIDGEAQEYDGDLTLIAVPIDLGYAINDRILVDLTVQFLMPKFAPSDGDEVSSSGLGDLWVKGRYIAPMGNGYLGGRLGIKAPIGKYKDLEDDEFALGDGQIDVDLALVGAIMPEGAGFAGNGQIGFRYRMKGSYTGVVTIGTQTYEYDYDYTPGMLIYTQLEPGYSMGTEKAFQIYLPILYETSMADKAAITSPPEFETEEETVEDSETSGLAIGLAPKYTLDANNTIGLKFLYPLMGKNVDQAMNIGLTYEGYIPF